MRLLLCAHRLWLHSNKWAHKMYVHMCGYVCGCGSVRVNCGTWNSGMTHHTQTSQSTRCAPDPELSHWNAKSGVYLVPPAPPSGVGTTNCHKQWGNMHIVGWGLLQHGLNVNHISQVSERHASQPPSETPSQPVQRAAVSAWPLPLTTRVEKKTKQNRTSDPVYCPALKYGDLSPVHL